MNEVVFSERSEGKRLLWDRFRERIDVTPLRRGELAGAYAAIASQIDGVAERQVFLDAMDRSLAAVWRMTLSESEGSPGYLVVLPLSERGEELLLEGRLDTKEPGASTVAARAEDVSAVYVWALCGPPLTFPGTLNVLDRYSTEEFQNISIYCRPVSDDVRGVFGKVGFSDFENAAGERLMRMVRPQSVTRQDTDASRLRIDVCRTLNDLHRVIAIRAMTYMAEQDCPFVEEFDGNDLCATQLVGYIDDEPVSCVRLRYFGSFVKVERLAVIKAYRGSDVAVETARAAIEFGRRKGFTRFYGHSSDRVASLWKRVGFRHVSGAEPFEFSGITYREMVMDVEEHPQALDDRSGALRLVRPEGQWDEPGVLERAAAGIAVPERRAA